MNEFMFVCLWNLNHCKLLISNYMKTRICLCVLAALLMIPVAVTAQTKKTKKEVAIQLYSVRDILNRVDNKDGKCDPAYTAILAKLAKMGYTGVEAANYNNGKFYDRTPRQFKKDVESAGMKVLSSHCTRGLSKEELASGDYSKSLEWWNQCIADHKAAGMKYIVAPWMDVPKTLKDLETYCAYYNEIGKRCNQQGLRFGYHNHAHEFQKVEGQVMYDYMLEHMNPEYVFFQMDVYWVVRGQNSPVDYFNKYPGRFKIFHIKDHREIGQSGMVGFDAIFKNAKTAGVNYLVAEIEGYSVPVEESVEVSLDYLLNAQAGLLPIFLGLVEHAVPDRGGEVVLFHPRLRKIVRVFVILAVSPFALELCRGVAQMQGHGLRAVDFHLPRRVGVGRVGGIALARKGKVDHGFRQRDVAFGHPHKLHGLLAGDGQRQGLRIGQPHVFGGGQDEPAADETRIFAAFEQAGQIVQRRVGIAAADRFDER